MERLIDGHEDDHEALTYHASFPLCTYYVQSPSSISLPNSALLETQTVPDQASTFHFPPRPDSSLLVPTRSIHYDDDLTDVPRSSALSRYSSDNNPYDDHKNMMKSGVNRLIIIDHLNGGDDHEDDGDGGDDDDDDQWFYRGKKKKRRGCWWKYFSFRSSDSCVWVSLQMGWRLLLSFSVALLVFYLATEPPPPKFSLKMGGGGEFVLGEGVDSHGVTTKILSCNYSVKLMIENKSKAFGLHIHPPSLQFSFRRIIFAVSHGPKMYAESHSSAIFRLHVGTKNKPMYGAGRDMQDMLESSHGLPLMVRINLVSDFRVVWNLIKPKFRHQAECSLVLVYDQKHQIVNKSNKYCILVT